MFDLFNYVLDIVMKNEFAISKMGSELRTFQNDIDNLPFGVGLVVLTFFVIDITALFIILRQHIKSYERITLKTIIVPLFVMVPLFYIGYTLFEAPTIEKYNIPPSNYSMMNIKKENVKEYMAKRDKTLDDILHRISISKGKGYRIVQKGDLLIGGNITLFITPPISNPLIVGTLCAVQGFLIAFFICQGSGLLIYWYRHKPKLVHIDD